MISSLFLFTAVLGALTAPTAAKSTIEWKGIPNEASLASNNTLSLNHALASLSPGTVLNIPNETYWLSGGVFASGMVDVTIELDGTFRFSSGREGWPTEDCTKNGEKKQCVKKAMLIENTKGLTLTTSNGGWGTVDGNGESWWGYINYLRFGEDRPKLLTIQNATDILVERWHFRQSAYHTFHADDVARLEIRHCSVENRVNEEDSHGEAASESSCLVLVYTMCWVLFYTIC